MRAPPPEIAAYLRPLPPAQRKALLELRAQVLAVAPDATERISYGIPAFFADRSLVWMAAFPKHCSFFGGHAGATIARESKLSGFEVRGSTIRFAPDGQLPAALVRKIVKARLAENTKMSAAKRSSAKKPAAKKPTKKAAKKPRRAA